MLTAREEFLAHRQRIIEARQRAQQRLDQLVVTGASGALVLSVTFIEKIAPSPAPASRWLLAFAWGLLLTSLLAALLSHAASAKAFDLTMAHLDACYEAEVPVSQPVPWIDYVTRAFNWLTILCFVGGMGALVRFAFVNVPFHP